MDASGNIVTENEGKKSEERTLNSSGTPSVLEPTGTSWDDNTRPDGLTLTPYERGRRAIWDVTCVDTLALTYIADTATKAGAAAEDAEKRKSDKYAHLSELYQFVPVGVESMGSWGPSTKRFFREIGRVVPELVDAPPVPPKRFLKFNCAVLDCRSQHVIYNPPIAAEEKRHFFLFPEDQLESWISNQSFKPTSSSSGWRTRRICDLHFRPCDIVTESSHFYSKGEPLKNWRLKKGAVPIWNVVATPEESVFSTSHELADGFSTIALAPGWASTVRRSGTDCTVSFGFGEVPEAVLYHYALEIVFDNHLQQELFVHGKPATHLGYCQQEPPFTSAQVESLLLQLSKVKMCQGAVSNAAGCMIVISERRTWCLPCRNRLKNACRKKKEHGLTGKKDGRSYKTASKEELVEMCRENAKRLRSLKAHLATWPQKMDKMEAKYKEEIDSLKNAAEQWLGAFEEPARSLVRDMKEQAEKPKQGRRHSPGSIQLCAELYRSGPKLYRKLGKVVKFVLPSPGTLRRAFAKPTDSANSGDGNIASLPGSPSRSDLPPSPGWLDQRMLADSDTSVGNPTEPLEEPKTDASEKTHESSPV